MQKSLCFRFSLLGVILFIQSCKIGKKIDYCKILQTDQSNLYSPNLTSEENERNLLRRKQIFITNFDILIKEIESNGFPIGRFEIKNDTCTRDAILATFIHISQTKPELFYSNKIVNILSKELTENRLSSDFLYTPVKIGSHNIICDSLKYKIEKAIKLWKVDNSLIDNFRFKKC